MLPAACLLPAARAGPGGGGGGGGCWGVHSVAFVVRACNIYDHPFSCLGNSN